MKQFLFIITLLLTTGSASAQTRQEYSYGTDPLQKLDVYRTADATSAPIIVMLHGGGWRTGDKRNRSVWQNKASHWTSQGYIFISVNTRTLPDAHPVEQAQDLATAMAFIQQNGASVGGDTQQMVLMGHSAGAHVAALLTTRDGLRQAAGLRDWAGTVVLDTAALDVETVMQDSPARVYRRAFGAGAAYWQAASPRTHVSRRDPPFLIVCSSQRVDSCPAAERFTQAATTQHVGVITVPVNLSHAQINKRLGEPGGYTTAVDNWIGSVLR